MPSNVSMYINSRKMLHDPLDPTLFFESYISSSLESDTMYFSDAEMDGCGSEIIAHML